MGHKTLMLAMSLALFFLAAPQTARAQKDGEAQGVIFDASSHPTLVFTNKSAKNRRCGALVSYTLMENQEEAIAARVTHFHVGRLGVKPALAEAGWLYITPTRIVFSVEAGDRSHGFDLPRTELKENEATDIGAGNLFVISNYVGMEFHLKEKLEASDSKTQKFAFTLVGGGKCHVRNSQPYSKFLKRAVKDFSGAVAEMNELADSLKQSGRSRKIQARMVPSLNVPAPAAAPFGQVIDHR